MRFCLLFIGVLSLQLVFAQTLTPAQQGGSKKRTFNPKELNVRSTFDYLKFRPELKGVVPAEMKRCVAVETEKERTAITGGEKKENFENWLQRNQKSTEEIDSLSQAPFIIPVVVHVIYSSPEENISAEQVMSQIEVLNQDYQKRNADNANTQLPFQGVTSNMNIAFRLTQHDPYDKRTDGIDRISMAGAPFSEKFINEVIKPNTIWNPRQYLNIWVCNISKNVLGFSQFPESSDLQGIPEEVGGALTDGLVISYTAFGTTGTAKTPFHKGRTATHELGHWLGLRHVWGDGDCDVDDFCDDTPSTDGPHYGCIKGINGCESLAMTENFMEYTNDSCMIAFTADQRARVWTVLTNSPRRKELSYSKKGKPWNSAAAPSFIADLPYGVPGMQVLFKDITAGDNISKKWSFPGGFPPTSTEDNPVITYNTPGEYPVTLAVTNKLGTTPRTQSGFVKVYEKGIPLPFQMGAEQYDPAILTQTYPTGAKWQKLELTGAYGKSNACYSINNYNNNKKNAPSWFMLPLLDFSYGTQTVLNFDVAYAYFNTDYTDSLGVYISTNNGKSFHAVYWKGGNQLSKGKKTESLYVPEVGDWHTEGIDLREYDGQSQVFIAFVNVSGYGNTMYLDNIRLSSAPLPLSEVNFLADKVEICAGESIQFTDKSTHKPQQWHWSFPGAAQAGDTVLNPIVTYNDPGTYDVSLNVVNRSGESMGTKKGMIVVKPKPAITLQALTEACPETNVKLAASGFAKSWQWEYNGKKIAAQFVSDTLKETTTFTLTAIGENGCVEKRPHTIKALDGGKISVFPFAANICQGDEILCTITGGKSISWSPATGLNTTLGGLVKANPTTSQVYTAKIVTDNGCTITKKIPIVVSPLPKLTVTSSLPQLCEGQTAILTASGATAYVWGTNQKTKEIAVAPTASTAYKLIGINEAGCADSMVFTLPVSPLPKLISTPSKATVCEGESLSLKGAGAAYFQWISQDKKEKFPSSSATISPSFSQHYYLIGKTEKGCVDTLTVPVSVIKSAPLSIHTETYAVCPNERILLTATGATSYEWKTESGRTFSGAQLSDAPTQTTIYTVSGKDAFGCKARPASVQIFALQNETSTADFKIKEKEAKICAGQAVQFWDVSVNAKKYYWEFPNGEPAKSYDRNPKVTYPKGGTHSVYLKVEGCAGASDILKPNIVTVEDVPELIVEADKYQLCKGESTTLHAFAAGISSFSWFPPIGLDASTGTSVKASPEDTLTYTVTGEYPGGCTLTSQITLNVSTQVEAPVITPIVATLCEGDSLHLTAQNGTQHQWAWSEGKNLRERTLHTFLSQSTTVFYTGRDVNGCKVEKQIPIQIKPKPIVSVTPPLHAICKGQHVELQADGAGMYHWYPDVGLDNFTGNKIHASPIKDQTYFVVGTDAYGCADTAYTQILVNATPALTFMALQDTICMGSATQLTAQADVPVVWSPATGLDKTTGNVVIASPLQTTTYTVKTQTASVCNAQKTFTLAVNMPTPLTIKASSTTICKGDSVVLEVSTQHPLRWGEGVAMSQVSKKKIVVRPYETTLFTVSAWDESGCEHKGAITITVKHNETATLSASRSTVCEGAPILLEAAGGKQYTWLPAPDLSLQTASRVQVKPTTNAQYKVVVADDKGCKDTLSYAINARLFVPQVKLSDKEIDLASDKGLVRFEDKTLDAVKWKWDFGDGGTSDAQNPIHLYSAPGTYQVKLEVSSPYCTEKQDYSIHIINSSHLDSLRLNQYFWVAPEVNQKVKVSLLITQSVQFTLSVKNEKGEILQAGRMRFHPDIHRAAEVFEVDFSQYPSGTYSIQLDNGKDFVERKVVHKK